MLSKNHFAPGGMIDCLKIMGHLNTGLPLRVLIKYPDLVFLDRPVVQSPSTINPWWLTRFTAGDGSFSVSITNKALNRILGLQVTATFSQAQHSRDLQLFENIKTYLGCGRVFQNKSGNNDLVYYTVSDITSLINIIIPHFRQYPLICNKRIDLEDWVKIITIISNGGHLTESGLTEILKIRNIMNHRRNFSIK